MAHGRDYFREQISERIFAPSDVEATLGRIEDFRTGSSRYGTLKAVRCIGGWSRGHSSPDFLNGISGILRQGSVLIVSLFSLI